MTDTERLDWIEKTKPRLYKSATVDLWCVLISGEICDGKTLRDAIDEAMKAEEKK